ncbi:hypothetical protein [Parasitella parasitica]|uniref:Uncharacterized protein n=1 Tax=Parasitella parasitica TaxID=35722 RepID=A0A0B7N902_9FUNG|nr:hypothetical protein [Parasitella parasitica]
MSKFSTTLEEYNKAKGEYEALALEVFGDKSKDMMEYLKSIGGLFIEDSDAYKSKIKFSLGEKRLDAVAKELKLMNNDNRHFYNADGIISHTKSGIEIGILETTGLLLQHNDPKETQDYIKAGYGLVAMLHAVGRKYHWQL